MLIGCKTRRSPAGHDNDVAGNNNDAVGNNNDVVEHHHDVDTAPPLGVLQTRVSRSPQDPSLHDMVSRAPQDPSLEATSVNDAPALSTLDRVDVSQLVSPAMPLPHPIPYEAAVRAEGEARIKQVVDLGDEVRYVRPSRVLVELRASVSGSIS